MSEIGITWFNDSPDAGPACICSVCGKAILVPEDDDFDCVPPLRMFDVNNKTEARFHEGCWRKVWHLFVEVEEIPLSEFSDEDLSKKYEAHGSIVEPHELDCRCSSCELFMQIGEEIATRKRSREVNR
jgi:hypothetical protein